LHVTGYEKRFENHGFYYANSVPGRQKVTVVMASLCQLGGVALEMALGGALADRLMGDAPPSELKSGD
jgi:hypothetical protein